MEHTHVLPHTCYHTRAGGGHRNRPRSLWLLFCVSKFKSQAFSHFSSRLLKILPISCLPQSILLTTLPGKWLRPVRVSGVVGDPPRTDSSKGTEGARRGERMGSSREAVEWTEEGTEVLCHWHTQAHTDTHRQTVMFTPTVQSVAASPALLHIITTVKTIGLVWLRLSEVIQVLLFKAIRSLHYDCCVKVL